MSVCESEMSEIRSDFFNGTVEQLCSITFRNSTHESANLRNEHTLPQNIYAELSLEKKL